MANVPKDVELLDIQIVAFGKVIEFTGWPDWALFTGNTVYYRSIKGEIITFDSMNVVMITKPHVKGDGNAVEN